MNQILWTLLTLLAISLAPAWAQPPEEASPPAGTQQSQPRAAPMPEGQSQDMREMSMLGMGSGDALSSMAESMKAMADMCRQMMEREMAMMPAKMAAYAVFGLLLAIALVLLIVLQVQWIMYWKRLLGSRETP